MYLCGMMNPIRILYSIGNRHGLYPVLFNIDNYYGRFFSLGFIIEFGMKTDLRSTTSSNLLLMSNMHIFKKYVCKNSKIEIQIWPNRNKFRLSLISYLLDERSLGFESKEEVAYQFNRSSLR